MFLAGSAVRADQVEMQNGDHYSGKVLSVSADTVVLQSEVLGKITVPRNQVAGLAFGTNTIATAANLTNPRVPEPTNLPAAAAMRFSTKTNVDLSAALRQPGTDTNIIRQIRQQMVAGSPEAAGKFDAMVADLLNGRMNVSDLRREAKASADQLRTLKQELGPDAGDSLDAYLEVLDGFINETATEPPPQPAMPAATERTGK